MVLKFLKGEMVVAALVEALRLRISIHIKDERDIIQDPYLVKKIFQNQMME